MARREQYFGHMNNANKVDAKINAIRAANGNDGSTCCTCGLPAQSPYRHIGPDGSYVEGCIDAAHGPHLTPTTNTYEWHFRKEAVAFRSNTLKSLTKAAKAGRQ